MSTAFSNMQQLVTKALKEHGVKIQKELQKTIN